MSRKYKFYNPEGIYFVSFATVFWIDVFIREVYFEKVTEALEYCRKNRGMKIYGYCIMPSHIHLLFKAEQSDPAELIRDLKHFTSTNQR
nr:transposase [uncultured Aggregatibacter sp.]